MFKKILLLLILLVTTNSLGFSQTDTTRVSLPVPIVRLTIKDLIRGDGYKEEVKLLTEKLELYQFQEKIYLEIISTQDKQIGNLQDVVEIKEVQINYYNTELTRVNRELFKTQLRLRIYNGVMLLMVTGVLISAI